MFCARWVLFLLFHLIISSHHFSFIFVPPPHDPYFFFFCSSHLLSSHFTLVLPPSRSPYLGSHRKMALLPLPHLPTVRAFIFMARKLQQFLPSSTCVDLYLPRCPELSAVSWSFFCIFANNVILSPRWELNLRTNDSSSSSGSSSMFEGNL